MRLRVLVDGVFEEVLRDESEAIPAAISSAVSSATLGLKNDLRKQIRNAGLGGRLANTWRSQMYQEGKPEAAGFVFSKAASIVSSYERGATIREKSGGWLAIPADGVRKRILNRHPTPALWEQANNKQLVPVKINPNLILLLAPEPKRRTRKRRSDTPPAKRSVKSRVIFRLVRQVSVKKRLELKSPSERWENALPQLIVDELTKEAGG